MPRIMLVDDEINVTAALRRTIARGAKQERWIVECFDDPQAALVRASETDFAVVVSDYRMPDLDGVEFLKRFRVMQPEAVRLILSASNDVEALLAAINQAGIFRYLLKPWDDQELCWVLREALLVYEEQAKKQRLCEEAELRERAMTPEERERQRIEAEEPGITQVRWGPAGEILLADDGDENASAP